MKARLPEAMRNTAGITYILEVDEYPLPDMEQIVDHVLPVYKPRLAGKTFAVRCKRSGSHDFRSMRPTFPKSSSSFRPQT